MQGNHLPVFPGSLRKNDALFLYGALQRKPFVKVYEQMTTEVVRGPSSKPEKEINLRQCAADDVRIVERRGGGGTVVLSRGVLVSVVVGERKPGLHARDYFNLVHDRMIFILSSCCTFKIERSGISDLACGSRKILGSSLYMGTRPYLYYYQSSLLVNPDISLFEKYLLYPPREPSYRRQRSHREFCTSLSEQGCLLQPEELVTLLMDGLQRGFDW
jgi:lipoate---protein ligase